MEKDTDTKWGCLAHSLMLFYRVLSMLDVVAHNSLLLCFKDLQSSIQSYWLLNNSVKGILQ